MIVVEQTKKYEYANVSEGCDHNLRTLLALADYHDWSEGRLAFARYAEMMEAFASRYGFPFSRTVAAFVALSPNLDYAGNLRSLASIMQGMRRGAPVEKIVTSSYNHTRDRACSYLSGEVDFLSTVKGPKITAFYRNIIDPRDPRPVTIDGHMVCAWLGRQLSMKKALLRGASAYETIADGVRRVAAEHGLAPNQAQAILWFTRKRVFRVKYEPQMDLLNSPGNVWKTLAPVSDILPYEARG